MNKHKMKLASCFVLLQIISISIYAQSTPGKRNLPSEIASIYNSEYDTEVSDEFNGTKLDDSKWLRRKPGKNRQGLSEDDAYFKVSNGTLKCLGDISKKKAGAIVCRIPKKFGFIVARFRCHGVDKVLKTPWHMAIWGNNSDSHGVNAPGTPNYESLGQGMESDYCAPNLMELTNLKNRPTWNGDLPAFIYRKQNDRKVKTNPNQDDVAKELGWKKARLTDFREHTFKDGNVIGREDHNKWQTIGLEYHENYSQMWAFRDNAWEKIGTKVRFKNNNTTPSVTELPKKVRKHVYWFLGNLYSEPSSSTGYYLKNSKFELDFFRFYEPSVILKSGVINENDRNLIQTNENLIPKVFPTPSIDNLTIVNLENGNSSAKVFDMKGVLVKSVNLFVSGSQTELNVSDLPEGFYILKIDELRKTKGIKFSVKR